ncbi:hypothetical protein BTUL_0086g00030 [Botrytis tulipae]|uniref:Uncharacterized protein n=1 Tax=Botrytis tulipae TaxID=87230 RepID=A0A4Z1EN31_9HELO|nr:hypothetical protein BTUL_0086g00030 [Botrytis tulipae]
MLLSTQGFQNKVGYGKPVGGTAPHPLESLNLTRRRGLESYDGHG